MSFPLYVQWKILGANTLQIERRCARCDSVTSFVSTEKFRLNANGNLLDAWLIYACLACGNRWNRTLFERRPVRSLPSATIDALQENNARLARAFAAQPPTRSDGFRPGSADAYKIEKKILSKTKSVESTLELVLLNPANLQIRLDRVLAEGLSVSRAMVHNLVEAGAIHVRSASKRAFRQPIREKTVIEVSDAGQKVIPDLRARLVQQGDAGCG